MIEVSRRQQEQGISIADLNVDIDSEPRVLDVVLGERLGMSQPLDVRRTIRSNERELRLYGGLPHRRANPGNRGGRPGTAYYLNEPQALLICMFSNTAKAAEVRKMLIDVFMEYRCGKLPGMVQVKAHERRTSTKLDSALSLARSAERLEAVASTLTPRDRFLSAMVVDGVPVVVDVSDTNYRAGDMVVGFDWAGKLTVTKLGSRETNETHRPGGVRLQPASPYKDGSATITPSIFAIGKVVERPGQHEEPKLISNDNPMLPGQYRGKRTRFRDEILGLLDSDMTNREIAKATGATYQTVTHWRRWNQDRAVC